MFMSQYHRVRYCRPVIGLILAKMAFGAPASAAKLIASIKARGVAPPSRSVGMSFALPATSGFGSPKPWRAAFLIGFLEMDALEPVGALQIARQDWIYGFPKARKCLGALQGPSSTNHATEKLLDTFQLPARSMISTATLFGALLPAGGVTLFAGKPVIVTSWIVPQAAELSISSVVQKLYG